MKARLLAVQKIFWILLATSVITGFLALPLNENKQLMAVFEELLQFQKAFDQKAVEQSFRERAAAKNAISLKSIVETIDRNKKPTVEAEPSAPPVVLLANVALGTLRAVNAFSEEKASVEILVPNAQQIGAFMWWRLSRRNQSGIFQLLGVTLKTGNVSASDIELEQKVVNAQKERDAAQLALEQANDLYDKSSKLEELRIKWKAPWKVLQKTKEKVNEAQTTMNEKKRFLEGAITSYENLAKNAETFHSDADTQRPPNQTEFAIAIATVRDVATNKRFTLQIPVSATVVPVPVGRLTGCEFPNTKAADLWDVVKDKKVSEAIRLVESRFSWHYRHIEITGVRIGGMTFLQWAPLVLVILLIVLMLHVGKAKESYNPYGSGIDWILPVVGFHLTALNFLALVILPTSACVLCIWSLLLIDANILIPVPCTLGTIGLGISCHLRMDSLKNLRDEITRSHRIPPNGPSK